MAHTDIDYASIGGGFPMGGSGFGGGAGGLFGGLILGALLGGNRRGGLFGGDGGSDGNALTFEMGKASGENAKYRDVVDSTQSITQALRNGFDLTSIAVGNVKDQIFASSALSSQEHAAILRAQCETDYKNLLQSKELSAQLAMSTCEIKQAVSCDGDKTRFMIAAQNEANLRDRLNEVQRERDLLATGNFPISQPAHVHRHHDCGNDHANQINIINQNVNALGSIVGQQADAVNKILAALAAKA